MPIKLIPQTTSECGYSEWALDAGERNKLVSALAYLYLRQELNAERVINGLEPRLRIPKGRVAENVIRKLAGPDPEDRELAVNGDEEERRDAKNRIKVKVLHRDGLLFQHISWIVARREIPDGVMTDPHVRAADKGFDGFIICLTEDRDAVTRIVLCEDKASGRPRSLISTSVWPDISSILEGNRDDEILADLTTLLKTVHGIDPEDAVDAVLWKEVREFRVAIATGENRRKAGTFLHIVDGFEEIAGGSLEGRVAGVLPFEDLRTGLAELADEVIVKVREIARV